MELQFETTKCSAVVNRWAGRNGAAFDEQALNPEGMFSTWWNKQVQVQSASTRWAYLGIMRRPTMSELKKCLFCGGEAAVCDIKEPSVNGWIGCQRCRCFMDFVKNGKSLAIAAWNRRAQPKNERNMNKTELAIEHFVYGISHDIYSEPVTTYAGLAVEALKEKAKRDKGCEYCNDMKYMPFGEHKVYIDGNGKLDVDDDEDFQLNFCPMCGKRLEGTP